MVVSWELRLYEIDHLQDFLKNYHNIDNRFSTIGSDKNFGGFLSGAHSDAFSQSVVSMNAPFRFHAKRRDCYAIISCRSGSMVLESSRAAPAIDSGKVACVSPETSFDTICPGSINMVMTRLDAQRVDRICSAWLGTTLDGPPEIELSPFSPQLQMQWAQVVSSIDLLHASDESGEAAMKALEEYAVSLLLHAHPHNYSAYLKRERPASSRIVADAEAYIREHAGEPITPASVAEVFGCSLGALRKGFEEHLGISMRECIYAARIARIRKVLLNGTAESYLYVLRSSGFMNIRRFETVYQRLYGETPTQTFERAAETPTSKRRPESPTSDWAEKLRAHIIATLSKPVKVAELAALVGMSETQFRLAFKDAFGMSPVQYILSERLNWAQWLLVNTDKSIAAIAAEAGFANQAHLTAMLKQIRGVTPGELRSGSPKRG